MEYQAGTTTLSVEAHDLFRTRRERVLNRLGDQAALVLAASPELVVGRDTELRYVADPELFYLTGYHEPDAVAVFAPAHESASFTLFVRPRDTERELWTGPRGGTEAATSVFGAQQAFPLEELAARLPTLLAQADVIYARLGGGSHLLDELLQRALQQGRRARPRQGKGPHTLTDPGVLLDELRVGKDAHEIGRLRRAAEITVAGFLDALPRIRPAAGEWEIEAALEAGFRARGADGFAFPTIVAGGSNATVLHYVNNQSLLRDGELVLIDAGARYRMYCGDISRTFPVGGRFSPLQRELYDAVLRAHDAAIALARPGVTVADLHNAAMEELLPALADFGLLAGKTVAEARADEQSYRRFCPHKTSHWLGLEVHDVGAYAWRSGPRPLEAGMVLTVEPGIYIPGDCAEAPAGLRGTGVRLEDDVLITETGSEVLTAALPIRADQIEALLEARPT